MVVAQTIRAKIYSDGKKTSEPMIFNQVKNVKVYI